MTTDNSSSLVPRLRFPEFRDNSKWELLPLSSVSNVNPTNDELPDLFIYIDLESVKSGMLINRNEITRDTAPSRAQRLLNRKDIIYQIVRPYQRNNFFYDINDGYKYVASTGYAQLRAHECPEFLYQLLHTDSFVNKIMERSTGSNYPAINTSDLASIDIALPKKTEQKKIADCLGSLDDLIAAGHRKLKALRQNKQGLMQQLFPQTGETMPKLRFPEFRDQSKWILQPLSSASDVNPTSDGVPERFIYIDIESVKSGTLIKRKDTTRDAAPSSARRLLKRKDIIYQTVRPYQRNNFFFNINDEYEYVASTGYAQLRANECPEFLYQLLHTDSFVNNVLARCSGSTYPVINPSVLASINIALPRKTEQQKIVDCLSSLDYLITAETQKLEALRQHKQGLMQQLFPSLETE